MKSKTPTLKTFAVQAVARINTKNNLGANHMTYFRYDKIAAIVGTLALSMSWGKPC